MASREDEVREVAGELDRLCDRLAASVAALTAALGVTGTQAHEPPHKEEISGQPG